MAAAVDSSAPAELPFQQQTAAQSSTGVPSPSWIPQSDAQSSLSGALAASSQDAQTSSSPSSAAQPKEEPVSGASATSSVQQQQDEQRAQKARQQEETSATQPQRPQHHPLQKGGQQQQQQQQQPLLQPQQQPPQQQQQQPPQQQQQQEPQQRQQRVVSPAERELRRMFQSEALVRKSSRSNFASSLLSFFQALPPNAVPHCRAELDACAVFRQDGTLVDLRSLIFESEMSEYSRRQMLSIIERSCEPPRRETPGFVVLSDVDDTLLPGKDLLNISGCDRSWHQDGSLYPGVCCLHRQLRSGLRDEYGGDYTVLLTARPPWLLHGFTKRFPRLSGVQKARMGILPGEASRSAAVMNTARALVGNFSRIGDTKVLRMKEYAKLFPDLLGRFVFIGDDGQADLMVAQELLSQTERRPSPAKKSDGGGASSTIVHALAWVAVKLVSSGNPSTKGRDKQEDCESFCQLMRMKYPALPPEAQVMEAAGPGPKHRFFFFTHYLDLAEQLAQASWISSAQRDAVERSFARDLLPDPVELAKERELENGQAALTAKLSRGIDDADEVERKMFNTAEVLLKSLAHSTARLEIPKKGEAVALAVQVLGFSLDDALTMKLAAEGQAPPRIHLQEQTSPAQEVFDVKMERDYYVPCFSDQLSTRHDNRGERAVATIDVWVGRRRVGTCYLVLSASSAANANCVAVPAQGGEATLRLLPENFGPDAQQPIGKLTVKLRWLSQDAFNRATAAAAAPAGAGNFF